MRTDNKILVSALRILVNDIQSGDGVANACIAEAADRIEELEAELAANIQVLERIARFLKAEKEKGDAK